ncbi:PTS IIA-like nitrogen regulatory protein PtsN [Paraneptunicella aestuarii]|uniref:PTS IIA-like nitrogen regulatory protein PtsN n=1 Tax=Paraneptunicella aestuarii TaxID=2831148 RepID=UPI001E33AE98|nr:PTS IIA-like nitrogen regulatory protein PtsN [Paraneptunicella aestuarii]UAA38467.1 PTS IIA-like nitrogen regulatory protein PtsN [Paraneptunicella aestuarii]
MDIKDILAPNGIKRAIGCSSKKRILELLSLLAADVSDEIDSEEVLTSLLSRERMGSTGIGHGIALPHGRLPGLLKPIALIITCQDGIEFDAIDNQPVDIFFAILVPENDTTDHLKILSAIANKLNDRDIVRKLRKAESEQALYEALV